MVVVRHGRLAIDRRGDLPFVFEFGEAAGQIGGVLEGDLFAERIGRRR